MLSLSQLSNSPRFRPRLNKKRSWARVSRLSLGLACLLIIFFISSLIVNNQQTKLLLQHIQQSLNAQKEDDQEHTIDNAINSATQVNENSQNSVTQTTVTKKKKANFQVQLVDYNRIRIAQLARKQKQLETLQSKTAPLPQNNDSSHSAERLDYINRVEQQIIKKGTQYYQRFIDRQGITGEAEIGIEIASNGHIHKLRLLTSSGNARLDNQLIVSIQEAAPFPPVPKELSGFSSSLSFVRWLSFSLEKT